MHPWPHPDRGERLQGSRGRKSTPKRASESVDGACSPVHPPVWRPVLFQPVPTSLMLEKLIPHVSAESVLPSKKAPRKRQEKLAHLAPPLPDTVRSRLEP